MAISTSKTEIFAEGTTNISWTSLQNNLGGQATNIRFGTYKRNPNDDSENPIVPDADENTEIGTEESGNLRIGAFRGAISQYDVNFEGASDYENVEFEKYFGNNIIKNVPKNINVDSTIYSDDSSKPAASINVTNSIRNLTIGIGTTGAIYGAGGTGTTGDTGNAGGTALYVSGTSSRNFKINLESAGGSFGKLYGGGGGGITGNPGTAETRNYCVRTVDTSYTQVQPRTCNARDRRDFTIPGSSPTEHHFMVQHTGMKVPTRQWNEIAQQRCKERFPGNPGIPHGTAKGGGCSNLEEVQRFDPSATGPIPGRKCFYIDTPDPSVPGPNRAVGGIHNLYLQGYFRYQCNIPGNPPSTGRDRREYSYRCDRTTTIRQSRGESSGITSPGGTGGPGGKGQGYQRSFESGTSGSSASSVDCRSLGTFSGPTATGGTGSPGTSGGAFGQPGEDSSVATGGLAGFAVEKTTADINIEIIGEDEDRLKGRKN
tara:strand:- start:28 stop:1485 length:1458 start_codon:yes stop_codon:yes gene_type:complete